MKAPLRAEDVQPGVRNKPSKLKDVKAAERREKREAKRAKRREK